jgi:RNA-directed DNA polymerase
LSEPRTTTELPTDLPEPLRVNGQGLPEKVFLLRQKLYLKAKREPGFRFYALYDRIYRPDVLQAAWQRVAANGGAPGVDAVSIQAVRDSDRGVAGFLSAIEQALQARTYQPQPVKRVYDADLRSYFDTIPHDKLMAAVQRRVVDGRVLKLIRMWLAAVVIEPGDGPGQPPKAHRSQQGTPQGGVISPLLANLYLHWFDKLFHRSDGPYPWANARLVRYADDFVILARYADGRIERFVEQTLQGRFGLTINRQKTRTLKPQEVGASLDFLGYTFRYDRDRWGRSGCYLNLCPAAKSLQRERDKLHAMTGPESCFKPTPRLIAEINRYLKGWANYFGKGYPSKAFHQINGYVRQRLERHLKRRSQRPYRCKDGLTWYAQLQRLGFRPLALAKGPVPA